MNRAGPLIAPGSYRGSFTLGSFLCGISSSIHLLVIGSLSRGLFADLLLVKPNGNDPYAAILRASPLDIRLVVVGGTPVYGDKDLMEKLLPQAMLEPVMVCHKDAAKVLYLGEASQVGLKKTWRETEEQLGLALRQWNITLAGLAEDSECGK